MVPSPNPASDSHFLIKFPANYMFWGSSGSVRMTGRQHSSKIINSCSVTKDERMKNLLSEIIWLFLDFFSYKNIKLKKMNSYTFSSELPYMHILIETQHLCLAIFLMLLSLSLVHLRFPLIPAPQISELFPSRLFLGRSSKGLILLLLVPC